MVLACSLWLKNCDWPGFLFFYFYGRDAEGEEKADSAKRR